MKIRNKIIVFFFTLMSVLSIGAVLLFSEMSRLNRLEERLNYSYTQLIRVKTINSDLNRQMKEFADVIFLDKKSNILVLVRTLSASLSMIVLFLTIRSKIVLSLIPGLKIIDGEYRGNSKKIDYITGETVDSHTEHMSISQSIVATKLSGTSYDSNGDLFAKFTGRLVDSDYVTNNYSFLVSIETCRSKHNSLLDFEIMGENMKGFHSAKNDNWIFDLKKGK